MALGFGLGWVCGGALQCDPRSPAERSRSDLLFVRAGIPLHSCLSVTHREVTDRVTARVTN